MCMTLDSRPCDNFYVAKNAAVLETMEATADVLQSIKHTQEIATNKAVLSQYIMFSSATYLKHVPK